MKGSSRLDVVSAGSPGMEKAIRNSLKKRFQESTTKIVKKLGEGWVSTSEGATTGQRSDDVGVTVSVYGGSHDTLGYRVKLDTVNANSKKKFSSTQEVLDSITEELKIVSRICTELSKKLSETSTPSNESDEQTSEGTGEDVQ